jgi:hypothetical protein
MICKRTYQPYIYNYATKRIIQMPGRMHKRACWIFLFLLCTIFIFADASLSSILEGSNFTDTERESIVNLFRDAEEKGIPPAFIIPRLEEGIAKNIPYNRLITALSVEIACLESARDLLLSLDSELPEVHKATIWLRTCILLSNDVAPEIIFEIASKSRDRWEDYREATALFLALTHWGLSDEDGLRVVSCLLESVVPGKDFTGVITLFTRARSMRISPGELIERMDEVINEVDTIESLEEKILF